LESFTTKFLGDGWVGYFIFSFTYIAIILAVVMTYPLYFFEARNTWLFFFDIASGKKALISDQPFQDNIESRKQDVLFEPFRPEQYFYIIILFIITFITAFFARDEFAMIVGLNGATAGNLIGLILPATFYIIAVKKLNKKSLMVGNILTPDKGFLTFAAWLMIFVGLASGGIGLMATLVWGAAAAG
jgi:hypothetical protein